MDMPLPLARFHPSRRRVHPGFVLAVLAGLWAAGPAARTTTAAEPVRCGTSAASLASALQLAPSDSVLEARLVFVTFPDSPDSLLPAWADSLANELEGFFADMSQGRFRVHAVLVRRTDAPELMWRAPRAAADYAGPRGLRWMTANREVLTAIGEAQPGVWDGVGHVWVLHDQCVFACTDVSSPDACEDTCPWAGISTLGLLPGTVPGLLADGTTQRFLVHMDPVRQHHVQANVAAHEFGHRIAGTPHTPGTDAGGDAWINVGRYDLMRAGTNGARARDEGLAAYHPLTLARWGWRPLVHVTRDTLGLRLPDLWSPRGTVVEVSPRRGTASFVLAHHGGRGAWDARYGGDGLHVWHVRRDSTGREELSWDLESAAGRRLPNGAPDPLRGRDPLEADPLTLGSAADLFTPGGADAFSALTNPASGLHAGSAATALETVRSGVALENLRHDPATGDLLVDVWVTPAQRVREPLAGAYAPGDAVPVRWDVRASAAVVAVDVSLVHADGSERLLAAGLGNSGAWTWASDETGDGLRLRVTSRDASGDAGSFDSEPFAIRAPFVPQREFAVGAPRPQPAAGPVTLPWSLASAARVRVEIADVSGRRVRVLLDGMQPAGDGAASWDGRDDRGTRVRPGVYLVRFVADGARRERRIVWIE